MTRLEIVWRNPAPRQRRKRRWHELACNVGRRLYTVEELVTQGEHQRWARAAAFEVVFGKRAVA
jgi:hypothetical protein